MHGYGIVKAVEDMSDGRVSLRAGTLYGALERLESQGYVAFDGEGS
jgi:DNA-binding PadR family transcriptional regulator